MYIPIFIAILMGLLAPNYQSANRNKGTVYVKFGSSAPGNYTTQTDSLPTGGGGDDDTGIGGPGSGGPGGNTGQNPPPPPKP
ncbi:MAG: hypothetical protein EOO90_12215 [Pedobacter sp.]|nr:MAG: hypothetical protein EOO90_12215 [Pedobacter sp.]